jgi:peroxiredoxin
MHSGVRMAVVLLSVAALGCSGSEPAPERSEPARLHRFSFASDVANQPAGARLDAEDAPLVDQNGDTVRVSDYRGDPVVLIFTRGWIGHVCPYCATYSAQIAFRYDEIKAVGGRVLMVFPTAEAGDDKIAEFTAACREVLEYEGEEALPFPVFLDPARRATEEFNLLGDLSKPSTFVLDAEGVVRFGFVGDEPHERPSVDKILEELKKLQAAG